MIFSGGSLGKPLVKINFTGGFLKSGPPISFHRRFLIETGVKNPPAFLY